MKLVAQEAETDALTSWLAARPVRITSILGKVEVLRAARRAARERDSEALMAQASAVMAMMSIANVTDAIADRAAVVEPQLLRTLDAVHLATAIHAGPLEALVAYDDRLADAARTAGIRVVQPGRR